jgi:hypothetical protein
MSFHFLTLDASFLRREQFLRILLQIVSTCLRERPPPYRKETLGGRLAAPLFQVTINIQWTHVLCNVDHGLNFDVATKWGPRELDYFLRDGSYVCFLAFLVLLHWLPTVVVIERFVMSLFASADADSHVDQGQFACGGLFGVVGPTLAHPLVPRRVGGTHRGMGRESRFFLACPVFSKVARSQLQCMSVFGIMEN